MTATDPPPECADCGAAIDENQNTSGQKIPCKDCGGTKRIYDARVEVGVAARFFVGCKIKRPGEKRPYVEDVSRPDYSRDLGKNVHLQRSIDRDNDKYYEKVTDYESGEIIHHCEEPLSAHQGHGLARETKNVKEGGN